MTLPEQVSWDALRCIGVAAGAFAIGWPLGRGRLAAREWVFLLAPLLTPALLISYAVAPIALHLTGQRLALLAFYSALLALKLSPLPALARQLLPSPMDPEATYCAQLVPISPGAARVRFALNRIGAAPWVGLAFAFLFAFTDFELASLLSVKNWAAMLFDAHAGGLEIWESLRRTLYPALVQLAVIVPAFAVLWKARAGSPETASKRKFWLFFIVALLISILPAARLAWLAAPGLGQLQWQDVFGGDLLTSLTVAFASAGAAWLIVLSTRRNLTRFLLVLPGILGGVVLSLCLLALVHAPRAAWWDSVQVTLVNSPILLLLGEVLLLMPCAVLLRALLEARRPSEALHLARMAGSRRLVLDLALLPHLASVGLLFLLAYFEFTAATILAPVGLTPVFARLHNLAHYGQTAVLSAMLLAALLAPALLLALTLGAARLYARRDVR